MVKLVNLKTGRGIGRWRDVHNSSLNIQYLKMDGSKIRLTMKVQRVL